MWYLSSVNLNRNKPNVYTGTFDVINRTKESHTQPVFERTNIFITFSDFGGNLTLYIWFVNGSLAPFLIFFPSFSCFFLYSLPYLFYHFHSLYFSILSLTYKHTNITHTLILFDTYNSIFIFLFFTFSNFYFVGNLLVL